MRGPIACIDIDYFYAQAEELRNPAIRGKPVLVCVYSGRTPDSGVVATCNYAARRLGVKSGMPIKRAKELLRNSEAVYLPVDKKYYLELSRRVFEIAGEYADTMEVASVDEAFLGLSELSSGSFERAGQLMMSLKKEILERVGLTCSIGVARNKLLAKMVADDSKPDGLKVLMPGTEQQYLAPKMVQDIPYIGVKTAKRLSELGVRTIGELSKVPLDRLIEIFGFHLGRFIHLASRGEFYEPVTPRGRPKQLSRIVTLRNPTRNVDEIWGQLEGAVSELHQRIQEHDYMFRGVSVLGVTDEMRPVSRSTVLPYHTQRLSDLKDYSIRLLKTLLESLEGELRRVGVRVYGLSVERGQSKLTDFQAGETSEKRLQNND